jgi:hypothetical protein
MLHVRYKYFESGHWCTVWWVCTVHWYTVVVLYCTVLYCTVLYLIKHAGVKLSNTWFNRHEFNVNSNVEQILKSRKLKCLICDKNCHAWQNANARCKSFIEKYLCLRFRLSLKIHLEINKILTSQMLEIIKHSSATHNTMQKATQHNTTQHNTTQHNTTQHNTTQHNTTQHNTTRHDTTKINTTK